MENFHHFLYASHFILESDQKPLEAILYKSVTQATPRILILDLPNPHEYALSVTKYSILQLPVKAV